MEYTRLGNTGLKVSRLAGRPAPIEIAQWSPDFRYAGTPPPGTVLLSCTTSAMGAAVVHISA